MSYKNLVLIGFMGTGKTTIGIALAKRLNMVFVDTDLLIEESCQMSIEEIFTIHGEEWFRQLEEETVRHISNLQHAVISTGGGIVLNQENIINLKTNAKIILLDGELETIISNLKRSNVTRPLLNDEDWVIKVEELLGLRKDLYHNSADFTVSIDNKSISVIIDEIVELYCK